MADPDGTAQLQRTATSNGKVTKPDADAIVADIERTRDNLARTIDTLVDRVSPANNARRVREAALERMRRPDAQLAAAAVTLAVVAVAIYRIWGKRKV
jgi:hypothetical protein